MGWCEEFLGVLYKDFIDCDGSPRVGDCEGDLVSVLRDDLERRTIDWLSYANLTVEAEIVGAHVLRKSIASKLHKQQREKSLGADHGATEKDRRGWTVETKVILALE